MKKLVIVAAVAFAAVISNAATIKWSVGDLYGTDGQLAASGYKAIITVVSDTTGLVSVGDTFDGGFNWGGASGTMASDTESTGVTVIHAICYTEDGSKMLDLGEKTINAASAKTKYTGSFTANNKASDWVSVPEPTSGLLLLLGVAGLALRRRRA